MLLINLLLTPLWMRLMYGNSFVLTGLRLVKNAVKLPLDTALLYCVLKTAEKYKKKM